MSGQSQHPAPPQIVTLSEHLSALEGPIRYSVTIDKISFRVVDGGEPKAIDTTFRGWVAGALRGQPPTYSEGLDLFARAAGRQPADGEEFTQIHQWVEYRRVGGDVLHCMNVSDEVTATTLLAGDLKLTYSTSGDRVLVKERTPQDGSYFLTPGRIVYPLGVSRASRELRCSREWLAVGGSEVQAFLESGLADTGEGIALCFTSGAVMPDTAVVRVPVGDADDQVEYVLTLYRPIPDYARTGQALGVYEVLQFDSLGEESTLCLQRIIVCDCRVLPLEPRVPLTLPVRWSERTKLRDRRDENQPRGYGPDVATWPEELVKHLGGW